MTLTMVVHKFEVYSPLQKRRGPIASSNVREPVIRRRSEGVHGRRLAQEAKVPFV